MEKNTIYKVEFADAHSFYDYLNNYVTDTDYLEWNEKRMRIEAVFSRYTMDENGYHIGYELYTVHWKMFRKRDLSIFGIPPSIFPYVVIPSAFDIKKIQGPIRNCARYFKPDADFVYQEIEHHISSWKENIPEAHFDSPNRTWTCGNYVTPLD